MAEKQFVGRCKTIETKYGKMHKVGISKQDFDKFAKNGWLNVLVKSNKDGNVYLELDNWQPKTEPNTENKQVSYPNDMPF